MPNRSGKIYYITAENLKDQELMSRIYADYNDEYYWSDDFSPDFYVELAKAGFISIAADWRSGKQAMLPQIQSSYAVLDFANLHISGNVKKLLKRANYRFATNENFARVISSIQ